MCEWFDETVGELLGYWKNRLKKYWWYLPVIMDGPPPFITDDPNQNFFGVTPSGQRDHLTREVHAIHSALMPQKIIPEVVQNLPMRLICFPLL